MKEDDLGRFAARLKTARTKAGFTQANLARKSAINRIQILRIEAGVLFPRLDEIVRIANVLNLPLEWFISGRRTPREDTSGIAIELYNIGIRDIVSGRVSVPGAFRRREEVLVLALKGDKPDPRVLEAIPFSLVNFSFRPSLAMAFAAVHDPRVRTRLAWLADITSAVGARFGLDVSPAERQLRGLVARGRPAAVPDSLGRPELSLKPHLIWRRWKVTYAGRIESFFDRYREVEAAYLGSHGEGA